MHNECIVIMIYVQEVQKAILVYFCLGSIKRDYLPGCHSYIVRTKPWCWCWMKYSLYLLATESFCGHHITVASEDN